MAAQRGHEIEPGDEARLTTVTPADGFYHGMYRGGPPIGGEMADFSSVLFPGPETEPAAVPAPDFFSDLHLDQIVRAITRGADDGRLDRYFHLPLHDVDSVEYRHEVFADVSCSAVRQALDDFAAGMRTRKVRVDQAGALRNPLQQQGWFVYSVSAYCTAVQRLSDAFADCGLRSRGLRGFGSYLTDYVCSERFAALRTDTEAIAAELQRIRYTVHIQGLRVHVDKWSGQTDYSVDIADTFERFRTEAAKDYHVRMLDFADMDHVEEQILGCVARLFPQSFARLADYCTRHEHYLDSLIGRFDREIAFYLAYVKFVDSFGSSALCFTQPTVTAESGVLFAENAVDLALAIKCSGDDSLVRNEFDLRPGERVVVVTGPNQGGKTTYARAVGQCAYLAALGCPVPATRACLTLPDRIFTHFERRETLSNLRGKLDDELVRIHDVLSEVTPASLIVMNESFASTTVDDAVLIGTEVLHRIIAMGCVAVYVSFLDELSRLDPACVSMVGDVEANDPTRRTFRFSRRPADGIAYASALAEKYGLGKAALLAKVLR